jgi:hypothetical protein
MGLGQITLIYMGVGQILEKMYYPHIYEGEGGANIRENVIHFL